MPKADADDGEDDGDGPEEEDNGAERPANGDDSDDAGADAGSRQNEEDAADDDATRREAGDADADEDADNEWGRMGELAADRDGTRAVRQPTASETCANPRSSSTARRRRRDGWTITAAALLVAEDASTGGKPLPSTAAGITLAMICTFSGFTSRCAMPQACRAARAVATSRMMVFAAAGGR